MQFRFLLDATQIQFKCNLDATKLRLVTKMQFRLTDQELNQQIISQT